ncbi:Pimeloyl-ACP methyl ester carboxylesterase [Arachidicoccus rhizosphaerae]|uniref:Pimeloyl-ACP methyl ester carboxylesterase n=1 Tax=Arachidicoccus rhizosphaerae TaxID=551991 RepID=A0A1H3Z779_9BACT|nr:alpha/beta hydrolase [Arachidicoccus rhizosphaerae]SEA19507.1 Pimeloyl-ACP methyl ester carboxylesterase [Arachidicoccus rhizosphaerae]
MENTIKDTSSEDFESGYSEVNGLKMYFEIYGQGKPLVLIHGGGSTIQSCFGRIIPLLQQNRKVIALELQAHGRTSDRNTELSFEQDADDVFVLLQNLQITKADFFGFSNGGTTTLQIAIRHPEIMDKMILASALARRNGVVQWLWDFMPQASVENMPAALKEAYLQVAEDPKGLQVMHDKDARRMIGFKDIPDQQIAAIQMPVLIINADKDIITLEHALELHRWIAGSSLAILPGGHGGYMGEITTLETGFTSGQLTVLLLEDFLNK